MQNNNAIESKSFEFAVRIVNLRRYLIAEGHDYELSKQLLHCGTSIGANVAEAQCGQSNADFNAKMTIALKEANETHYWLRLLHQTEYLSDSQFKCMESDAKELIALLTAICRKTNS